MALIDIEKIVSIDYDLDNMRDRILSADDIRELHATITSMDTEHEAALGKCIGGQPWKKRLSARSESCCQPCAA